MRNKKIFDILPKKNFSLYLNISKVEEKDIPEKNTLDIKTPLRKKPKKIFDLKFSRKKRRYPQKTFLKSELFRFVLIGVSAIAILNIVSSYHKSLELKNAVTLRAEEGVKNLKSAYGMVKEHDLKNALFFFEGAALNFSKAENEMKFLAKEGLQKKLAGKTKGEISSAVNLIISGENLSSASKILVDIGKNFTDFLASRNTILESGRILEFIKKNIPRFNEALAYLSLTQKNLSQVNENLLAKDTAAHLKEAKNKVGKLLALLEGINRDLPVYLRMLGDKYPMRYLILLQNSAEIRATGGFIGSYIIADINDGKLTKIDFKDVYETDNMITEFVPPPPGIDRVADSLGMRDANYYPDFPASAKRIMWFLEHSGGPTVDAVIAVNDKTMSSILSETGEISIPGTPFKLTAQNFNMALSFIVESKVSKTSTPKQVILDLIPQIKEKIAERGNLISLLNAFKILIGENHITAYSSDPYIETFFTEKGISGRIKKLAEKEDYLLAVDSNIGGNKSDFYISSKIYHQTKIQKDFSLQNKLIITKRHTWGEKEDMEFEKIAKIFPSGKIPKDSLKEILGAGKNSSYMRVYVPKGSVLISVKGINKPDIKVYDEFGRTVFAFYFGKIARGEEKKITLNYFLPFKLNKNDVYKLLFNKQMGVGSIKIIKDIVFSGRNRITKIYPETPLRIDNRGIVFKDEAKTSKFYSVIFGI